MPAPANRSFSSSLATTAINTRIAFLVELATRLHKHGASSPRLEMAISGAAQRLGLSADVWSSPTAIIISFMDLAHSEEARLAQVTQVIRLLPGDVNLDKLCRAEEIADRVIAGNLDLREGFGLLRALELADAPRQQASVIVSYGLSAAAIDALFLQNSWVDLCVAAFVGLIIGTITILSANRPRLQVASDAICAMIATLVAIIFSAFVVPLAIKSVVLAGLIVLVPGMSLTTAVREISSQHLVSGMARMGGAMATLLKLTFGTVAATRICALLGIEPRDFVMPVLPGWMDYPALLLAAIAFAMLFRAAWRDWPAVIFAVIVGYVATRVGGAIVVNRPGAPLGVFLGGLLLSALANMYARFAGRPGAVIREPGILLLVPGSAGFRSVSYLLERNAKLGFDSAVLLVTILISLVAGLMFGELLIAPRRSL